MSEYNAKSVQQLTFREGCRKRIGVYLGSADNEGINNGLLELVNNATDEAVIGYGNEIIIEVSQKWASCRDFGRGIPVGPNEFSKEVLITLLTQNHSGAKFDESSYKNARGLNGTGSSAVCCSSDWLEVHSYKDGKEWFLRFEEGIPLTEVAQCRGPTKEKGTYIKFQPSQSVFSTEEIMFDYDKICGMIEEYTYFNTNVIFTVRNVETKEERKFQSKNGLVDFANKHILNTIHTNPVHYLFEEDGISIEIICQWTKGTERFYLFSNGAENVDGGTPITGIKTSITRNINKLFKKDYSGDMARKGLIYVISIKHPNPIYANQTKNKISNGELRTLSDRAFSEAISQFARMYGSDLEDIRDFLQKEEKAEFAAQRARVAVLENQKVVAKEQKKKSVLAGKLTDCSIHDAESQLIILEGKSAAGSIINARDSTRTACYPMRGKPISVMKASEEDILANEEIKELQIALGLTIGEPYSARKLRYGKIGIMTDADVDGYSISCLILAFFFKYFPQIITEGRIFWARTPLFRVKKGKDLLYAYDEEELTALPKGEVTRFKGIGELNAQDLRMTALSENSKFVQFTMDDAKQADYFFNLLLGEDVAPRAEYIFENIDFRKVEE